VHGLLLLFWDVKKGCRHNLEMDGTKMYFYFGSMQNIVHKKIKTLIMRKIKLVLEKSNGGNGISLIHFYPPRA
jgi:hypothetical protein